MSKSKLWIILILIIVVLAIYGYFKAIPGSENQAANQPRIEAFPKSWDFKEINYGEILEYTFKVKNLGKEVLEIRKVATSCACTTAEINKERINPNEEAELLVRYDTGAMSGSHAKGNQERIIYIRSNDSLNPQIEVMIYAYVR